MVEKRGKEFRGHFFLPEKTFSRFAKGYLREDQAACASQNRGFWTPTLKNTPVRDRSWPIMGSDPC